MGAREGNPGPNFERTRGPRPQRALLAIVGIVAAGMTSCGVRQPPSHVQLESHTLPAPATSSTEAQASTTMAPPVTSPVTSPPSTSQAPTPQIPASTQGGVGGSYNSSQGFGSAPVPTLPPNTTEAPATIGGGSLGFQMPPGNPSACTPGYPGC